MTIETLKSAFVTLLDAVPTSMQTAGEGTGSRLFHISDTVAVTASGMGSIGSTYRLCRFPTNAKVKRFTVDLGIVDTGAAGAVFDLNIAFSSDTNDGTPSILQSLIPTTVLDGTTTTIAAYTTPNKLFGSITAGNNAVKQRQDLTFNGTLTGWSYNGINLPLWRFFGFTDARGNAVDPGGYFDILFRLTTAATTGAAANIGCQLEYSA